MELAQQAIAEVRAQAVAVKAVDRRISSHEDYCLERDRKQEKQNDVMATELGNVHTRISEVKVLLQSDKDEQRNEEKRRAKWVIGLMISFITGLFGVIGYLLINGAPWQ